MSKPVQAAILQYEHEAEQSSRRNELQEFEGKPHLFWKKYKSRHRMIANVARCYLCIQSTSCEAERVFNKAGYLTSNRKSNLGTSNLRHILFSNNITKALTAL
ncbi:hypothetical protein BGZ47_002943 [Haplosporangium gracile]|nr:hypothetical protein BGZ47_002943 [Haplosporangium gracile]